MTSQERHFAHHLAANSRKIRDNAVARLRKWIRQRSERTTDDFNESGMMFLWRGLYYCMWQADKPLVQEDVADNISSLIHAFSKPSQVYGFIGCFFKTMGQNHDRIDKYRLDKFLMLTRRFFRESLKYLREREWQHKHVQKYLETLRQSVLARRHNQAEVALGFKLHFFDIFLEELARVGEGELPQKRAHNFLEPFYEILTYCKSPMLVDAVRDKIFYELIKLSYGALTQVDEDEEDNDDSDGFLDDEAEVDETAFDSDTGETANVSEDEDEDRLAKRRKSDKGFLADEPSDDDLDDDIDDEDNGDLEEQLIKEAEDAAEVNLCPVDFDLSAIKASLKEYMKVTPIGGRNKKAIENIIKKIVDLEQGTDPFALPEEDSGSDLELTEEELKRAAKRLKQLEREYAEEAENFLVPENNGHEAEDKDEFEIEGGEEDVEELENFAPACGAKRKVKSRR